MIRTALLLGALAAAAATAGAAQASEGDWRLGRVYYRMVCTACHAQQAGQSIAPSAMTKAEWTAYLATDRHDASGKSNPQISHYASQAYRESVKDTNKAAAKFLKTPEDELMAAISAFVIHGAKDSDNPASCQ